MFGKPVELVLAGIGVGGMVGFYARSRGVEIYRY